MKLIWIAAFGAAGVLSRYGIAQVGTQWFPNYPVGTLFINVAGAWLAGGVAGCASAGWLQNPELRAILLSGFLGGFTTFSAYCLDTQELWQKGGAAKALIYFLASPLLGLGACLLGFQVGVHVCRLFARG